MIHIEAYRLRDAIAEAKRSEEHEPRLVALHAVQNMMESAYEDARFYRPNEQAVDVIAKLRRVCGACTSVETLAAAARTLDAQCTRVLSGAVTPCMGIAIEWDGRKKPK